MRKQLPPEFVAVLLKVLRDEKLNHEERKLVTEFLKKNEAAGVTSSEVFNLLTTLYKLYDIFKDYLE
jgi:hypothetical protein